MMDLTLHTADETIARPAADVDAALYACLTSIADQTLAPGVWLMPGQGVASRHDGADHAIYAISAIVDRRPWLLISLRPDGETAIVAVRCLYPALAAEARTAWSALRRGVALALEEADHA